MAGVFYWFGCNLAFEFAQSWATARGGDNAEIAGAVFCRKPQEGPNQIPHIHQTKHLLLSKAEAFLMFNLIS